MGRNGFKAVKGVSGLYHRDNGMYYARFSVGGKKTWQSLRTKLKSVAEPRLEEIKKELREIEVDKDADSSDVTMGDLIKKLKRILESKNLNLAPLSIMESVIIRYSKLGQGLTFEGWVFHTHIDDLTDLAKAFPDTTIIFNHLGGPIGVGPFAGRRKEVFAAWKTSVAELAKCPNVFAKVGGLQMIVNGYEWHKRDKPPTSDQLLETNRDWYNYAIDQFGPKRCMFESNFPVDKLSCSYTVLWNQFKKLTKNFSEDERVAMFHDTAKRVYRLPQV